MRFRIILLAAACVVYHAWAGPPTRTLLVHPDEFTDTWIDRVAALGIDGLSLHPVGGAHAADSLNSLLKDLETPAFRARIDRARAKGIQVGYECHAASWLLPRDLFKTHPEYFRVDDKGQRNPKLNFCFSNAEALDIVARRAVELAGRLYGSSSHRYFFWLDDVNGGGCACAACRTLTESDQQLIYVNRVVAELRKTIPDAMFCYLAYYGTVKPPRKVRPAPGVFLEYAPYQRDMKKPVSEQYETQLRPLVPLFDVFGKKDARLLEYWYDNSLFSHYRKPPKRLVLDPDVIARDLATYRALGFADIASFACYLGDDYERLWGAPDLSSFK